MANPTQPQSERLTQEVHARENGRRSPLVQGRCPACHKPCLILGDGGYVTCSWLECPDPEAATKFLESSLDSIPKDAHMEVLLRAHAIYLERESAYAETWREYGTKGAIVHLRTCVSRAWRQVWSGRIRKFDNLLDAINYCVFTIRNAEDGNTDGTWGYE